MLGGMLAGHEESGGTVVEENGEKFMLFLRHELRISNDSSRRWRGKIPCYGRQTVKLPLRGLVENTARDISGGLRSACTYVGHPV